MSQKEFQRVKVIENAAGGRLSVCEASRLLQLSERQVQRLKRRYRPDSVGSLCTLSRSGMNGPESFRWERSCGKAQTDLTGG
ncbi:MAG: helix-turn-helix domain-containing protein [Terriglobales bacterium]